MATDNFHVDLTYPANADLSAKQYLFVKLLSTGKVDVCSATTDKPYGILQNKPTANQAAQVRILGISKLVYAGTTAAGDALSCDAAGKAVTVTNAGTTLYASATAVLSANTSANDVAQAFVNTAGTHKHA